MNAVAYLALAAFPLLCVWLFRRWSVPVAVTAAAVGGFLFLPVATIPVPGVLPDYGKELATTLGIALGITVADPARWRPFRLVWIDALALANASVWSLSYFANGAELYAALSSLFNRCLDWGVPYWLGRTCFRSGADLQVLAKGVVLGGLAYLLPCLWEVRFSPQLHTRIYGFFQHDFVQMMRSGGYRPIVFLRHGLQVALWMSVTALVALALWRHAGVRRLLRLPMAAVVAALAGMLVLCKSLGALLLGLVFAGIVARPRALRWVFAGITALVPGYLLFRVFGGSSDEELLQALIRLLPEERAASAWTRFHNETLLVDHALQQPWFGWTIENLYPDTYDPWGETEEQRFITDSAWIIAFVSAGAVGLFAMFGLWLTPAVRLVAALWRGAPVDGAFLGLATLVTVWTVDSLANFNPAPLLSIAIGALAAAAPGAGAAAAVALPSAPAAAPAAPLAPVRRRPGLRPRGGRAGAPD